MKINANFVFWSILYSILISVSFNLYASSRVAKVNKDSAVIYSKPQLKSQSIKKLSQGEEVRIGNKVVRGWVKGFSVRNGKRSSNIGFLRVSDLSIQGSARASQNKRQDQRQKEVAKEKKPYSKDSVKEKKMYFGLFMPFTFYTLKPLEEYLLLSDAGISKLAFGYGGEFAYNFLPSLWGQLRIEYLTVSQKFDASATGGSESAEYVFSSFLVSLAPEYHFGLTDFIFLEGSLGLAGFISPKATFLGVDPDKSSSQLSTVFAVIPRVGLRFKLSDTFSFGGGMGYRYAFEDAKSSLIQLTSLGLTSLFLDLGFRVEF